MSERKRFIPKARTYGRWTDISGAPLEEGDMVIVWEPATENQHTFKINKITQHDDMTRLLSCTLMDSTNHEYKIGTTTELNFSPTNYVPGAVIKKAEIMSKMDSLQINDAMIVELYKWLMDQPQNNYRRKFTSCVAFLVELQLIPENETEVVQKKRLTAALKMRPEYFKSANGYVAATGVEMKETSLRLSSMGSQKTVRRVKLGKVVLAIRLILESGLFGDIIIDE